MRCIINSDIPGALVTQVFHGIWFRLITTENFYVWEDLCCSLYILKAEPWAKPRITFGCSKYLSHNCKDSLSQIPNSNIIVMSIVLVRSWFFQNFCECTFVRLFWRIGRKEVLLAFHNTFWQYDLQWCMFYWLDIQRSISVAACDHWMILCQPCHNLC